MPFVSLVRLAPDASQLAITADLIDLIHIAAIEPVPCHLSDPSDHATRLAQQRRNQRQRAAKVAQGVWGGLLSQHFRIFRSTFA